MDDVFASFIASLEAFLNTAGDDPFKAMGYLLFAAGWVSVLIWIPILYQAWHYGSEIFLEHRQEHFAHKQKWINLRITVPNVSEQTPKAAENFMTHLAGAHSSISWAERWRDGAFQSAISLEICCTEGRTSFHVNCIDKSRDLIEAAIYAQYPDAEIEVVEDYARKTGPAKFPDPDWEMWGCEFITVKPDAFSLKTYRDFEDSVSGEFKDPVAGYLEVLSRLGPGEHCWMQISLLPTDQDSFRKRARAEIDKLKGIKVEHKKTLLTEIIEFPLEIVKGILSIFLPSGPAHAPEKKKDDFPQIMKLTPIEREILESTERKAANTGFECKIRFLYLAKRGVFSKARIAQGFVGAIKQTNTFHMQALKPDFKKTGMSSSIWWFKDRRNTGRKNRLIQYYRSRDGAGRRRFFMSTEELATLWHFPILIQVKAPSLRQIEAKKSAAPVNIPFADENLG